MKVEMSFTTKTIVILLAMVLTVTIVISMMLIREADSSLVFQQQEERLINQRRLQLFEDILHNRMVLWVDMFSHVEMMEHDSLDGFYENLQRNQEYLMLNFHVERMYLFDQNGVVGEQETPIKDFIVKLVRSTQHSLDSRALIHCDLVCTHYLSVPIMTDDDVVPVVILSASMRELLSLFNRSTDAHKIVMVQHKQDEASVPNLTLSSQLSQLNQDYLTELIATFPQDWSVEKLVVKGLRVSFQGKELSVSLLPFPHALSEQPYLMVVQDITALVQQTEQYELLVIVSAIVLFIVFALLLRLFLNQYRIRLLGISERLPMLADHKFNEYHKLVEKRQRPSLWRLNDELDVVEDAANALAKQLEDFDGQMAVNTAKLEKMAMFDVLTGLPNRNMLTFQIENLLAHSTRDDKLVALMFMDLDDFKKVNDSYGHDVGDRLLKAAAMRISRPLRETDIATRFGGDEFVVLLSNVDNKEQVERVAEKIIEEFSQPIVVDDMEFYVSISIGVAVSRLSRATPVELLRHADIAMYEAKSKKGAAFRVYDATMNLKAMKKVELEAEARVALRESQFSLALQPQIDLRTNELIGFEALLRWYHPEKGHISPADFIPPLENTSFMLELDYWVIAKATYLIRELNANGYPNIKLAINLSAGQFLDPSLPDFLQQQIIRNDISPSQVCLELTETVLVTDIDRATAIMRKIRDMGCTLAIDDFGTGYSSLSYLKSLPADFIKIDRSFVANIVDNADDRNIVHSTIAMVRNMGLIVVAEGIETAEQFEMLCHFDCQMGQGYLIGRPIPEPDIWTTLSKNVYMGIWDTTRASQPV
ncbi:bifunctional diguanylate cyclase/phosphodiesterase [Alteromonas sp. 1_MG-2023]|uniref:putative bifunctional diguanylate cyclase/phosphodiesterase n=1 Tax=Alteromonas sp. 1_MG-2023 TaxID=3062669 RepID=UPI0026E454B1|nr:bifunctional diguanylate cyclase/phosphodiesterase [Alteromonas sp. 1_MG-2023]MDO6566476.1 bifunctional diguanylate cyclase/phosphodiesterase [Alteromonas sp. 1_MG-2023]